ncbi:MAG: prepilin-type N-terminal cleavage/methylation domain-containing protein [Crocinitomicaceae bacterium]
MKRKAKNLRLKAYTLFEILIVLTIIGMLIMLAVPNQASAVAAAKAIEAKSMLNQVHALEKNYFYMYSKHSMSLEDIGFEQERLATEGGNANYRITITEATATSFVGQAEAVLDFDGDGTYNVWTIDQDKQLVEVVKD